LIAAAVFIVYLLVFDKDPNPNAELEIRAEMLQEELASLDNKLAKQKDSIESFYKINEEWVIKDSLNTIELNKLQKDNRIIGSKLNKASAERKKSEKMLEEFKKNGYMIDNPVDLILDTKKRIGNND
jgi:hypothetical protein